MKIDRRSFLALGIGGAAGTAVSPLPWKLLDDVSIWSQNWPWTPVPPDGDITYENSVCTLCPGGCGITVRKVGDRVIKVDGMKGHPVNDGGTCILGLAGPQLLYSPTRVKSPLKKVNGKFKEISWEDAISEVAGQLTRLKSRGKAHTLACIAGSDKGTIPDLFKRFLTVYGSPNFIRPASMFDSYSLALKQMHGSDAVPGFDFENSDYVISFGSGIIDGWGSPVRMFRVHSGWKQKKATLVQAEPRLSNTASKADRWLPIQPGTEAVLALGLACVILTENLYDRNFISNQTAGFEDWKQVVVENYHPEKVSEKTGISPETIKEIGRGFARSERPIAVCGRGEGRTPGSVEEVAAVHALNALVGNINQRGGVRSFSELTYQRWPEPVMDATAMNNLRKNRIDGAGSNKYPDTKYLLNKLPEAIVAGTGPVINILFVVNANPCYTMSDTRIVRNAFEKIPFKVSFSTYMDETAQLSDLILPNHCYLERYEDVHVTAGLTMPLMGLARPVVDPQLNTRNTGDVIIDMAKEMGGSMAASFRWGSYTACLKQALGSRWNYLIRRGYLPGTHRTVGFTSASGKFEFPVTDSAIQVKPEGDEKSFPLLLIPNDSMRLAAGFIGSPPFLVKTVPETVLKDNDILIEINPATASEYGLPEGGYAKLRTPRGEKKVKIYLTEGIRPGVVSFPRGLGHTAYDKYLADKGINFNELIGPVEDPASGMDVAWGIRANLTRA